MDSVFHVYLDIQIIKINVNENQGAEGEPLSNYFYKI